MEKHNPNDVAQCSSESGFGCVDGWCLLKGKEMPMAEERRFPCPYCGAEFHFTQDETRLSVPCAKCGHYLVMPHGQFSMIHATDGAAETRDLPLGTASGGLTGPEWSEVVKANAIAAIRRWEEVAGKQGPGSEQCQEARKAVYWAMWPLPSKSLILDGKRYKALVRGQEIRVTPLPEKKPKG